MISPPQQMLWKPQDIVQKELGPLLGLGSPEIVNRA